MIPEIKIRQIVPPVPCHAGKAAGKQTKAKPDKRVDAAGRTVVYRAQASQKVQERIQRALPGEALCSSV